VTRMTDKMNLNATKEEWFNWEPNTDGGEEWRKECRMRWDTGRRGGGIPHPPAVLSTDSRQED